MKPPKIRQSRIAYSGFFSVREDLLERSDGQTLSFASLVLTPAVVILAQDREGRFILTREYRHAANGKTLGCPGGGLSQGEDPIEGGKRELLEETGYTAEVFHPIGIAFPLPALCDQKIHYLYAPNAYLAQKPSLDPFEFIEVELKGEAELIEEMRISQQVDGILCTALWYKRLSSL